MKEKQERNLPVYSTGLSDFLTLTKQGVICSSCQLFAQQRPVKSSSQQLSSQLKDQFEMIRRLAEQ